MADDQDHVPAGNAGDAEMAEAGSSSSDDSDFEELELSPEDTKLLMKLEGALQENPNLYDSHVQYIEVLRRCKMSSRLREARQTMHAAFPLTEALWFDWLSDEIEGLSDPEEIPRIEKLLDEAAVEYLSIPLWVQYLEFVRDFDLEVQEGGAAGQQQMRDLCERALTAGGLHVTDGSRLWKLYREYEQCLLEAAPSEEQTERVRSLWTRQLQVPLADGPQTLEAYEAWERSRPGGEAWQLPAAVKQGYERARAAMELRQPYEGSVAAGKPANADLLAAYMAYIKVEERQGDPGRVQVLYERALAAFPVTHYLWMQYARYLEAHLKINSVVNAVYARALRNCPWVGQLWGRALRALERSGAPDEQHAATYERALAAGLQGYEDYMEPVLARLDCLRRRGTDALPTLRSTFKAATDLLHSYFPDYLDRAFRLTAYWAECEAGLGGDLAAARAVWEAALKGVGARYADTWAAYIDFERRRGHTKEARTLYKRCHSRRLEEGGQALMCDAWLRFEREEGGADDHLAASLKVEPILQELQAAATAAADPQQHAAAQSAAAKAANLSKEEVRAMRQQADPNFGKRKQQSQPAQPAQQQQQQHEQQGGQQKREAAAAAGDMPPPPAKKPRTAAAAPAAAPPPAPEPQVQQQQEQQEPAPAAAPPGEQQQLPADAQEAQHAHQEQHAEQHGQQPARRPGWRQERRAAANTAFVKHLADEVNEAALQEMFGGCTGGITSIELGRDRKTGRSKGFAYIHFETPEGLEAACQMDRTPWHGKTIFVAPSKPPGGGGDGGRGGGRDGGRGGGRDGFGRGRGGRDGGRGGRGGWDGGRGGCGGGGRSGGPKHRSMIDLGSDQQAGGEGGGTPAGGLRGFVPRAAALQSKQQGGGGGGEQAPAGNEAPKSNADFRAMFLKK